MKKNTVLYYLKKHKIILFIIALFLSLFGSYQVYHGQYTSIIKEVMVIIYSAFKLFTFSPTKSIMTENPLAYELAVWIAPAFTMVGFFSVFQRIYKSIRNSLLHIKKSSYILMGNNENTTAFISNLYSVEPKARITFFADVADVLPEDRFQELNVKLVKLDFSNPENRTNVLKIRDQKIRSDFRIISFEREPKNYGKITALHKMFEGAKINGKTEVHMQTESSRIKELMEPGMDKLSSFNLHYFQVDDLIIKDLLENSSFRFNLPLGLKCDWSGRRYDCIDEISEDIGVFNVLIIGYSSISENFLSQISNYLTVNAKKNLKVTIIDEEATTEFREYQESRSEIEKVIDTELIDMMHGSRGLRRKVLAMHKEMPFSAVLFSHEDINKNIYNIDKLADSLEDVPFAVYAKQMLEIDSIISSLRMRHKDIHTFGDKSDVLTVPLIIDERLMQYAKNFNHRYTHTMNEMMGYDDKGESIDELWSPLSNVKKESSISQAAHKMIKITLIERFAEALGLGSPSELIDRWREMLEGKTVEEQIRIIENDPYLNYMTALEHKRWNNFYYMRDFVYGEEKNEIRKTHDCLIDDWTEFLSGKQREKAIYDTLSVFNLDIESNEEGERADG